MPSRFFVDSPIRSNEVELAGTEAHHAIHVLRCRAGDQLVLFDGSGAEFPARVIAVGRSAVRLAVTARVDIDRESPREVVLGVALPKGDRQRWLVEKLVELGVARVVPLTTRRGVAQPVARARERLERAVIEASKQCGRNRLMKIDSPTTVSGLCAAASSDSIRLVAHPGGLPIGQVIQSGAPVVAAIGPEGGFTEEEVEAAVASGWQRVSLGARILRVETAAVAVAAWAALRDANR